jgi:DNA helicase-2/ATP-dependent DNA helicase PcrA
MLQTEPEDAEEAQEAPEGAPTEAGADRAERLLAELNEPQREAVRHGEGPLLVLAGAGSGKTRVLTHRIAYLLATGKVRPGEILAITFTNKAANEMRERVGALVGGSVRAMWVTTFHSACARMLRADAERLGYSRGFTIYDESDSLRMLKRCMEELHVDPKRYPPRAIRSQISGAKNQLIDADAYAQAQGSVFEETAAGVYTLYEKRMLAANAMDFDDLLVRTVNALELFEEVRERWRRVFRHVLVDEYQDTNHAQYRLLQLLTSEHGNLMVVGDEDQCLVEGTLVTMGDGSQRPIEQVRVGDEVLSCFGSGVFKPSSVTDAFKAEASYGIKISTASGREIVSTSQHTHFAGYRNGLMPDMYMTYAMRRHGVGFRVGMTRTLIDRRGRSVAGVHMRAMQQRADAAWVVTTRPSEQEARVAEAVLAANHGIPTLPFMASSARTGVMSDQGLIDRVFDSVDSVAGGLQLLEKEGLDLESPHHCWQGFGGVRRNLVITLCADQSGKHLAHTVSLGGRDPHVAEQLRDLGFCVTAPRPQAKGWRSERSFKSYSEALAAAEQLKENLNVSLRRVARLGARQKGQVNSLPFISASAVRPGMVMFTEDGGYDTVIDVERVVLDRPVFDLNVEATHNFIANGLITHNSIYGFRGAQVRNVLEFERDFPEAEVVKLEQNYRSTQTILSAANAIVERNRERRPKRLWTELAGGEPLRLRELGDEHEEARWVAGEIERLGEDEGVKREDVAVFYRTNAMSRVLEDTLVRFELPYQVIGGTKFYERAEIKDAVAYLSLLANPADQVSFARIVNSPRRGIGKTSQGRLAAHANTTGLPIWEVAERVEEVPGLGAAAIKAISRFQETMEGLRARADEAPVAELLEATLHETGYLDALSAERTIEAEGRVENLEALVAGAAEFDANRELEGEGEESPLEEFLQQISLITQQDELRDESAITLMTLHNAKGLEYQTVFVIGCEEGAFPHMKALEEGGEEEERRLCYVGITRARRRLYMTWARERSLFGRAERNLPSRFVDELPAELTERDSNAPGTRSVWGAPSSEPAAPIEPGAALALSAGDDVVHASFGDGVVTAVEPGGVVVVRFAGDGSERKLMADYAPIRRRL